MITSNLNARSSNWLDLDGQNVERYEITSNVFAWAIYQPLDTPKESLLPYFRNKPKFK